MDFRRVKRILVPEGEAKELRIEGVTVWRRAEEGGEYGIEIVTDNSSPIKDFIMNYETSYSFECKYTLPKAQVPSWSVSGLPSGLGVTQNTGEQCTISGYVGATGTWDITVNATCGEYSDSKVYKLTVDVVRGIEITQESLANSLEFQSYSQPIAISTYGGLASSYANNAELSASYLWYGSSGLVIDGRGGLPPSYSLSGHVIVSDYVNGGGNFDFTFNASSRDAYGNVYHAVPKTLSHQMGITPPPAWLVSTITIYGTRAIYSGVSETFYINPSWGNNIISTSQLPVSYNIKVTDGSASSDNAPCRLINSTLGTIDYNPANGSITINMLKASTGTSSGTTNFYLTLKNQYGSSKVTLKVYRASKTNYTKGTYETGIVAS